VDFAGAGAVEFGEEDALPAAEGEFDFFDEDELGAAGEDGFDVGVSVAFGVAIGAGCGDEAVERAFGVGGDIGVGAFVDDNSRGGVRDVEEAGAAANAESGNDALDVVGDVEQLGTARSFDLDGLHSRLQVESQEGFLTPQTSFGMTDLEIVAYGNSAVPRFVCFARNDNYFLFCGTD